MRKGTSYFFLFDRIFLPIDGARAAKKSVKHASEKRREERSDGGVCIEREIRSDATHREMRMMRRERGEKKIKPRSALWTTV